MALAAICVVSCTNTTSNALRPPVCPHLTHAHCEWVDQGRFDVTVSANVIGLARNEGIEVTAVVSKALEHVGALLPGPPTSIGIAVGSEGINPQIGVGASTDTRSGDISIMLAPRSQIPMARVLRVWLPQALSHEIDHSVRVRGGPGLGTTLLDFFVSEGMADAFDAQAWPNLRLPWDHALTVEQEHLLWARAVPLLNTSDPTAYRPWIFGAPGIPEWAGFAIGFHIVRSYLVRHPAASPAGIVHTPAPTVLAGSGYSP